jgi:hypothetical protein
VDFTFGCLVRFPVSLFTLFALLRCSFVPTLFVRFAFHNVAFVRLLRFPRSVARLRFRCFARSFVTFVRYLRLPCYVVVRLRSRSLVCFRSFVCSRCTLVAVGWVDSVSFVALRFGLVFLQFPLHSSRRLGSLRSVTCCCR